MAVLSDLLPNSIIFEIAQPELEKLNHEDWIQDGLPRTRQQAIQLDKLMKSKLNDQLNLVVSLEVQTKVILKHITERWIHAPSGRVYNTTYRPPKVMGKDNITGEPLIKCKDDMVKGVFDSLNQFKASISSPQQRPISQQQVHHPHVSTLQQSQPSGPHPHQYHKLPSYSQSHPHHHQQQQQKSQQ
ncbi:hypothetical protein O181_067095 [Austropuccinia psidii MF-1]|uniref:Adenylate kinase active site lid domain-containing protein n=1 Tax=Austropuccinia psidii MF-1 TaxID=1389203 RepID=A0A9Q3I5R5_9BASI|nr:hypothetical protein [Austropuccinia psidii MF-1]